MINSIHTSSSGYAPALSISDTNMFSILSTLNEDGLQDSTPVCTSTMRDSTPFSTLCSSFVATSNKKTKPKNNVSNCTIDIKENKKANENTNTVPTDEKEFPDGGYMTEYLDASFLTSSLLDSHFHISIILGGLRRSLRATAMVDSGATALFINRKFAVQHGMIQQELKRPIILHNIDGTLNKLGSITHYVRLRLTVGDHREMAEFMVTDIGPEDIILGLPWLRRVNLEIDWAGGKLIIEEETGRSEDRDTEEEEGVYRINASRTTRRQWVREGIIDTISDEVWCAAGYSHSQRIAEEAAKSQPKKATTFEEIVPEEYRSFKKVFSEEESQRLPEHQPWDHKIDLKPDAPETLRSKVYPMSHDEEQELDKFLKEQTEKGYITPSKSPMSSPVFFIKKKDGKLRLVQDYHKLNEHTVKNRYPLPLAQDIINRLRGAKVFSKMDVRWGYYNIRITEGDEWKAAFTTSRGLFEPRVMFFGLTNAPATFQALMNTIFSDLVAKGLVAVYLDDILVFTQTLEEHREVVKEVL